MSKQLKLPFSSASQGTQTNAEQEGPDPQAMDIELSAATGTSVF